MTDQTTAGYPRDPETGAPIRQPDPVAEARAVAGPEPPSRDQS